MFPYPGQAPSTLAENVSLVDLLPTIVELASDQRAQDTLIEPIDGNSLIGLISDGQCEWGNVVFAESLAEGSNAAQVMVKKNQYKYVASAMDPPLLYDLSQDPMELCNLAATADCQDIESQLRQIVDNRWNLEQLSRLVEQSQRRRIFVAEALKKGVATSWDFVADDLTGTHCLRPDKSYNQWAYDKKTNLSE